MKLRRCAASLSWGAALLLFRICSFSVPVCKRESWRNEWVGELWQVRESSRNYSDLLRFAIGALPDAFCLLFMASEEPRTRALPASRCIATLASVAALATSIALFLPSVRGEFRQASWRTPKDVSVLFLPNAGNEAVATITPERFLLWKEHAHFLQELAFYQIEQQDLVVQGRTVRLRVAHVAGDLVTLVGASNLLQNGQAMAADRLILSSSGWQRVWPAGSPFEIEPGSINGHPLGISGGLHLEDSGIPGEYDAWLVDARPLRPRFPGFVIGRFVSGTATNPYFGFEHFAVRETQEFENSALAFPVAERKANPWYSLGLGFILSLLALPATTPLGFGEKTRADARASALQNVRRWLFMFLKCLLCAVLAADLTFIVATLFPRGDWRFAVTTRILGSFVVMLLALRWAIHDQRKRCPVCLNQLTNPARVGEPSRSFLSWSGTELVCESGHGLMHVPAHATSWFSAQRWLSLDSSWQFLFAQKR